MTAAIRFELADLLRAVDAATQARLVAEQVAAFDEAIRAMTGVEDFFDIETGDAFDVAPAQALAYFRAKGLRASFSYADMLGAAHDQAVTVAKMMDVDMLAQVRASLDSALANGTSFAEWKKGIEPMLRSAGWWGVQDVVDPNTGATVRAQLGSAWRLETIFRTNIQSAYAVGAWQEIEAQAEIAPFLVYDAVDDFRTREQHRRWDRTCLPVSSDWWKTHYPPNGWNCRCGVIQLDADQLREMGLGVSQPPEDGTYKWNNPRTDQVERIPNGIDPGFDRNPGQAQAGALRQLLAEKINVLPEDMQIAAKAAIRRQFDTMHQAGRWHAAAMDKAPDWLRDAVLDQQFVEVQAKSASAWAQMGRLIDMDGRSADKPEGQSVWRHEFGHILDSRIGQKRGVGLYVSSSPEFTRAVAPDADALVVAAGRGRKSKANDARRAGIVTGYTEAVERVINAGRERRGAVLLEIADENGVDLDKFLGLLAESTEVLIGGDRASIFEVGVAARVARLLVALGKGDGEGFVRLAVGMGHDGSIEAIRAVDRSWRKDGSLGSLSDLIGSSTKNKAAAHASGFSGHSDAYYRQAPYFQWTEAFANFTALAGHPNPYWWEIAKRFFPGGSAAFETIIRGEL